MGRYRVRSLMRQHDLRSAWKRKFVHTTDSRQPTCIADLAQRARSSVQSDAVQPSVGR